MKLFKGKEYRVIIGDYETLACCMDFGYYNPDTKEWMEFEISEYKNELYQLVKFYNRKEWDYIVTYNGNAFDNQIMQFILTNYSEWGEKTSLEIVGIIYQFVQDVIEMSNYNLWLPFREEQFTIPSIDVYKVFGLDNEARISSLKKCAFQIDECVEEMPIHHTAKTLSEEEIAKIKKYRRNDVLVTYKLLLMAIGDTIHPLYKGNNQLEIRVDIQEEFGIECMNYSDIKIGDEIIKTSYAKAIGKELKHLPNKGMFRKEIKLKYCIPSYVEFKSPELQQLLKTTKRTVISQTDKYENKFEFKGTRYVQALGGLHSENENETYIENDECEIHDYDCSSMYPAILINNSYYPHHLGKELLETYKKLYERRISLKKEAKTDKRIKGITDGLKLSLNVVFGKIGNMESWLYDKQCMLSVTLTGQFSLLMLIEAYELEGIHVFSANTDGISVLAPKSKLDVISRINKEWEEKTKFVLEKSMYNWIVYSTVNDYIAEKKEYDKPGERLKKKGDFITEFELWKNKSNRIVALALEEYFDKKTNVELFINIHKNIFDFCIMAKAGGSSYLEEQWMEDGCVKLLKHQKLIRYYLSNTGRELYKRGIGTTDKKMNVNQQAPNELGKKYIQYFNEYVPLSDYKIDYRQYIYKTLKIIDKIEKTNKAKHYAERCRNVQQLSMF
jgi:hypothetical protein